MVEAVVLVEGGGVNVPAVFYEFTESTEPRILDEQTLAHCGSYSRVRRYLEGWHPELGILHMGLQGEETIVETDVIRPMGKFRVFGHLVPTKYMACQGL